MLHSLRSLALIAFVVIGCSLAVKAEDGFESIFNGKDLTGWEGKDFWTVKDGCITGTTTAEKPTPGNTFLIWKGGEVKDFELKLKFRIVGGNSGIQYRSSDLGDFVVGGYQADIDSTNRFLGILYEERGRGILANRGEKLVVKEDGKKEVTGKTCNEEELLKSLKNEDWNDYTVIAKGNHLIQIINGHTTVDVVDNQAPNAKASGILALQLHAGPPMVVQFKDVMLKQEK